MTRHRGPGTRWVACTALVLATALDLLDVTVVTVALPSIARALPAGSTAPSAVMTAYSCALAVGILVGAQLGRRVGLRRVFLLGVVGFGGASLACGFAGSFGVLVVLRAVQGLCAAGMVAPVLALVQWLFPPERRGGPLALLSAVMGMAATLGPLIGGWLIDANWFGWGWRLIFLLNTPVMVVVVVLTLISIPADGPAAVRLDWFGLVLGSVATAFLVYGLSTVGRDAAAVAILAAGAVAAVAFHRHQRRPTAAVLPAQLRHAAGFLRGLAVLLVLFGTVMQLVLLQAVAAQQIYGLTPLLTGLALLPWTLGVAIGAGVGSAALTPRLGWATPAIGFALLIVYCLIQIGLLLRDVPPMWLLFLLPVGGAGMGLVVAPATRLALEHVSDDLAASASGLVNAISQVGSSLGFALGGTIYFVVASRAPSIAAPLTLASAAIAALAGPVLIRSRALERRKR